MQDMSAGPTQRQPASVDTSSRIPDRRMACAPPPLGDDSQRLRTLRRCRKNTPLRKKEQYVVTGPGRDLILGITPFELPNPQLAAALCRAGALGILDLGRDSARARPALAQMIRWTKEPWGVRLPAGCALDPQEIPAGARTVLLGVGSSRTAAEFAGRRVLVEVTDLGEAHSALAHGADGLIGRGSEGGGHVGELTTYVLLQQLLIDPAIKVPVWAAGGIGRHSASAAMAGGAAGIVLDSQLALLRESIVPKEVTDAIAAMDGSETAVVGGHRIYSRPDLAARACTLARTGRRRRRLREHRRGAPGRRELRRAVHPSRTGGSVRSWLRRRVRRRGSARARAARIHRSPPH